MTAAHIDGLLHERHNSDPWVYLSELRDTTGFEPNVRSIDGFAIHVWPSKFEAIAYEIKVTRADFQRELLDATKRRPFVEASTSFYFVTPVGLVQPHEVPEECGLMEARPGSLKVVKPAPCRDVAAFAPLFVAAVLRRRGQAYTGARVFKYADREMTHAEFQALVDERTKDERARLQREVEWKASEIARQRQDEELAELREIKQIIARNATSIGLDWHWTPEHLRDRLGALKVVSEAADLADRLEAMAATLRATAPVHA